MTGARSEARELPSRDECLAILREHACNEEVIKHCVAVSALAVKIAKKCRADVALVEAGALLHDIGRCKTHGMAHAVEGAKLASKLGLPGPMVRIIERHIGAGITAEEAEALNLPKKDYVPQTLEEKIVAHADNLISGDRRTSIKDAVSHLARKEQHDAALRVLRLHEELSDICGSNIDDIW
ncbi:MAG: TIGR00295 family protein [Thermoplasmata archaeon]|nr:TIGR00295 family protein [Thermoplasmata archaeon]